MGNGVEYYFVEVTCNDGIQYGIQAYGDEARALYKETNRWTLCKKSPKRGEEKFMSIKKTVNDNVKPHIFDNNDSSRYLKSLEMYVSGRRDCNSN
jgi:hypothetical protein